MRKSLAYVAFCQLALSGAASAQLVGVALDPKGTSLNGVTVTMPSPPPDSAVFFEFSGATVKRLGQVSVPTASQGPPSSVAVAADRSIALVSASTRIDPNDPKRFAPNNKLSVIDLTASPIRVSQTLELAASPISIAMNREGTMALAMHQDDDSVTVLAIAGRQATIVEKLPIGKGSGPFAAAFSPDGRSVLMTRAGDHKISMFAVEGGRLRLPAIRDMSAGIWPFGVVWCGNTGLALVGNFGLGTGDADTVSLLDVAAVPPRVVDTVSVGSRPEGVGCAPDGRHAATAVQNMSNRSNSPFYSPHSKVVLLRIEGKRLHRLGEAPFGAWAQGLGFLDDSRTLFTQSVMDRSLHLFRIEGDALKTAAPPIVFEDGAPVALGIAGR